MIQHMQLFQSKPFIFNSLFFKNIVHFQRVLNFFFYHPVSKVNIFCSVRTMQEKFERIKVAENKFNKLDHCFNRNIPQISHVVNGYIIKASLSCSIIPFTNPLDSRLNQCREQCRLIFKVPIVCSSRNPRTLAKLPKICAFIAIFKE